MIYSNRGDPRSTRQRHNKVLETDLHAKIVTGQHSKYICMCRDQIFPKNMQLATCTCAMSLAVHFFLKAACKLLCNFNRTWQQAWKAGLYTQLYCKVNLFGALPVVEWDLGKLNRAFSYRLSTLLEVYCFDRVYSLYAFQNARNVNKPHDFVKK